MSSSKKIDLQRDFAAGVYLSDTPLPPPLYTVFVHVLIHTEKGEGRYGPERRLEGGNSSQSWVENTKMTDCISSL